MYINSPGTSSNDRQVTSFETEAFAISDTMTYIAPEVETICLGTAFGTAAMLLANARRPPARDQAAQLHHDAPPATVEGEGAGERDSDQGARGAPQPPRDQHRVVRGHRPADRQEVTADSARDQVPERRAGPRVRDRGQGAQVGRGCAAQAVVPLGAGRRHLRRPALPPSVKIFCRENAQAANPQSMQTLCYSNAHATSFERSPTRPTRGPRSHDDGRISVGSSSSTSSRP